jgi:hypothetical protein
MSSTLATTCPFCGLRFPGRPLLDLHMREDHLERNRPAEADHDDSDDTGTPGGGAGGPSRGDGPASGQARIAHEEVIAMTTKQRPRSGRAMTALRRAIGILRSPGRGALPPPSSAPDEEPAGVVTQFWNRDLRHPIVATGG